jgi:putative acetyltransferase
MFLRPYRPTDKRMIQQLFFDTVHQINAKEYSQEQIQAWAPVIPDRETWSRLDQQHVYVVEFQRQIVGFASLDNKGLVDFLYIHKDFQNRGIATNLLKQLERVARKFHLEKMSAKTCLNGKGFFENKGFLLVEEYETKYKDIVFRQFLLEKPLNYPALK